MKCSKTQIELVKELDFYSTDKIVIQHILHMLDTSRKVEQMKNYLKENQKKS